MCDIIREPDPQKHDEELSKMGECQGCGFKTYMFNLYKCDCGTLICHDCDRSDKCGKYGCDEKCGYCNQKCVKCVENE